MKNLIFIFTSLLMHSALAQSTPQEGLDRIKSNFENSKSNLTQYQTNLEIVGKNLAEVKKAQAELRAQEQENERIEQKIKTELAKVQAHQLEIARQVNAETALSQQEQKKILELKKDLEALEKNSLVRAENLRLLNSDKSVAKESEASYTLRSDQLKEARAAIAKSQASLAQEEQTWINKQRGYQGEVNRWKKEADRNQKLMESYSNLAKPD
jgi:septal ring factor EnvC (AmiA/AmiB activator)